MKNKSYFLLGGLGMVLVMFLILGAAAPAPVQRNQWSTNVQGQPIIGDFAISNAVAGSGTNFILASSSGLLSLAPGRQIWKLYGWGNSGLNGDSALDWFLSQSKLSTNGGLSINLGNIALNPDGSATFAAVLTNSFLTASRAVVSDANKRLTSATGTPDGTKFLRDDNTYAVPTAAALTETTLAYSASTVTLDFSSTIYQFLIVTNDTTITNLNQAAVKNVVLSMIGNNTNCNLTFPPNWQFLGAGAPALLASNKWGVLSLTARGTSPTNIIAAYSAQP